MTTILIVDDDPITRNLLQLMLQLEDYTVLQAATGLDALAMVKQQRPDAVILNRFMPQMNGLAVCRRLRADKDTVDLPIIMLSAHSGPTVIQEAMQAGANKYLTKPMKRQVLLDALADLIQGRP